MVCNGEACGFSYRSPAEAVTADLIILRVKFMGMESALETVKPFVGEHTLFLSVLNGISSEEMIEKSLRRGSCALRLRAGHGRRKGRK